MCGCSTHTAAETETTTAVGAATFIVPDMTCGHCEKTVRGAFDKAMPGAAVDIDLSQHRVTVDGDAARVRAVLVEAGYPPKAA